ncbi:FAD-binding protein [Thermanaerosceptrum fracticalcis]|uniref:FAD-binding protein n=1 Tax=Thermanaerosceptrum fracticalcis TaxID=1712410 RepID=A0A7G6E6Z6_THEFR|nr:FAD-binding oxidoreductase [Thermanaerosceptrum fracticalcis]QNB47850.1 FAD-binding protein [Thermanaerosceptrum fracticalcis]
MTRLEIIAALQKLIGDTGSGGSNRYERVLEKNRPELILYPNTVEEVSTIVKQANIYKIPVYPVGNGTRFLEGTRGFLEGILLSTNRLKGVVEYRPDNMSVEVESGLTISELRDFLVKDNIFFPAESDHGLDTIGGLIATNGYGRKRYLYKSSRFYVMGMEFVSPQGEIVRVGGRTVKNVSGYDVSQLLAGSWGLFGIITKVTLRLKPLPEKNIKLSLTCQNLHEIQDITESLHNERISLASLLVKKREAEIVLQLELEGFKDALEMQEKELKAKYGFDKSPELVEKAYNSQVHLMVMPDKSLDIIKRLDSWEKRHGIKVNMHGIITNGVFELEFDELLFNSNMLNELTADIQELQGRLVYKGNVIAGIANDVTYKRLLADIKRQVDPNGILVPESLFLKE